MRALPTDNRRPAILLAILSSLAVVVLALTSTIWIQYRAADRGYTTELRGALRKYGSTSFVPKASIAWLARVHGRTSAQVVEDLTAAATAPSVFDAEAPLHETPDFLVQFFLDHGFLGLWLALTVVGLVGVLPAMVLVNRRALPPRRRPSEGDRGWN